MFENIISFSVRNKFIIALFTVSLIGAGFYSLNQIPINAVPDITNNQVQVVTSSPSLSAEEVERFITYPVEISMANMPGVVELRSISRYGLSVVTVVFDDDMPVTDARQFVSEQISIAAEDIPPGLGQPQLMPITTGLGEIYQYTLEVDSAFAGQYNAMDLRTIQDWIVKRQLSGIRGVVEVSSFGGFLKQIQVSVDPARLRSFGLTIRNVLDALETNNQNTGGSYLERGPNAVYIRAEGVVKTVEDIGNIVVEQEGSPVLLRQVATIETGYPPRYGAMTKNGEGEAVGGITLMLKDANSSETLDNIHQRIESIQSTLPEGIRIVPYLDRSELVARTTGTIKKNLLEGGLIVIFVLVLLLGNLRAGFIVASVIPLSLMFAFIMMHLFGVSANLMSLGALDFGIVVDGAVIIVEGVLHSLFAYHVGQTLTRSQMDDVVIKSASSIYRSAAFGVLIIVVVFIPIMTLTGIEGKMFRPMAQTVSFAVLGALLLSVTYVPMLSALILKKHVAEKHNISDRIISVLQRIYRPGLQKALDHPAPTVFISVVLLIVSIFLFTRLGGVFIPQLEEGDIAMQMTLPTGSSLDESIRTSTQAEQILLRNFPEVKQVVSKIGTAEVPTDPMSVELADIMIVMKEKEDWTSADNREELVSQMEDKLSAIIGASFDFTQPIQLRFNELMTGAKTDVAIKIYGEDMNILHQKAVEAAAVVAHIEGAADIAVEQTEGLPQLLVQYNRQRIARHGISIEDLNTVIRTAFAGERAGVVFEGERKFDLVVRLTEKMRGDFNLSSLFVKRTDGELIPVSELAEVKQTLGPAQISRDDTKRRVTIGINVRGRDVESLVNEAQAKLSQMDLPPGYSITYGGDFENLQKAKQRLTIAVPIALVLILILLYFAFGSFKYALLIFVAVPLSAIGGIFALWIRDLPFSISAGVGFIALFGVAVLNGIVLISYFNDLKDTGKHTLEEIIVKGGLVRLRPVIMTASVAALGFLPMALSETAGAEVQRPLATVVIGGLVSATLLTLVVLPVLYRAVERYSVQKMTTRISPTAIVGLVMTFSTPSFAQDPTLVLSEQDAVTLALTNNPRIKIAGLEVEGKKSQQKTAFRLPSTNLGIQYGQMNSAARDPFVELSQNLGSLPAHVQRSKVYSTEVRIAEEQRALTVKDLTYQVRTSWQEWLYLRQVTKELHRQLALYEDFEKRADLQYRLGERSLLEKTLTENSLYEVRNKHTIESENLRQSIAELRFLLVTDEEFVPEDDTLASLIMPGGISASEHPVITIAEQSAARSEVELKLERSSLFPEVSVGYFRQNITETDIRLKGLQGWTVQVAIPLWFRSQQGNIQRSRIKNLQAREELALAQQRLNHARAQAASNVEKYKRLLAYYGAQGLHQANAILRTATLEIEAGEIDFFQYLQSMQRYTTTRLEYLQTLRNYNLSIIELEYLSE
jgi:heavy metal efflux system protein